MALNFDTADIERIRQLLQPKLDARYTRSAVYQNNVLINRPVTAGRADVVTSTGAVGVYALNFAPAAFAAAPIVVAWCSLTSGGAICVTSLAAVTSSYFQFYLYIPGIGAIPVGQTVTVEWIAVGA